MKKGLVITLIVGTLGIVLAGVWFVRNQDSTVYLPYEDFSVVDKQLVVYHHQRSALIDEKGELLTSWIDGVIKVIFEDLIVSEVDKKVVLSDRQGQLILETDDYHEFVEVNHDGFLKMRDHQWNTYFLDHQGKRVVIDEDEYVYKGRKIIRSGYDKYALVDAETGKELVPVGTYEFIHEFNDFDLARVEKGYDRRGMMDLDGNEVVPCQYKRLEPLPEIGYIAFEDKNSLWGLMDQEGKIVLKAQYDGIKPFSSEVMLIELDDRYGFLDKHFNEVIPPKYERINEVENTEDLIELELNGKKRILNKSLKTLLTDNDFDGIRGNHYFKHLL
ncbi:MAG: WG repeat-containing protein, partial [Alcaligenaceae bacterium]|nr:WG repeat-containing protein [Alcaligenaceae bacterium]